MMLNTATRPLPPARDKRLNQNIVLKVPQIVQTATSQSIPSQSTHN
jgi:hypothetical protein